MTRRQALVAGAAAGVTATLGAPGNALAAAAGGVLAAAGPSYLRRGTYLGLVGDDFTVRGHVLRLVAVEDVQGAHGDPALKGHEAAFALRFDGPADVLQSEIQELHHDLLGPFPLFMGAEGDARGTVQSYGATVDRTVRVKAADLPEAATQSGPGPSEPKPPEGGAKGDAPEPAELSARDAVIVQERLVAANAPQVLRRRAARRAHGKLRQSYARRATFKRKQRARVRNARTGWLKRHGR